MNASPSIARIAEIVAQEFFLSLSMLAALARTPVVAAARKAFAMIARDLAGASDMDIGRVLRVDSGSALHMVCAAQTAYEVDATFRRKVLAIMAEILAEHNEILDLAAGADQPEPQTRAALDRAILALDRFHSRNHLVHHEKRRLDAAKRHLLHFAEQMDAERERVLA